MDDDIGAWELELLADCEKCSDGDCQRCIGRPCDAARDEWCPHYCDWLYPDGQRPGRTR